MTHEEREALEAYLKGIVLNLPEKPGSYQYYDDEGTIIYVGKAKNLKRRVSSYFNKEQQSRKTALLVSKIRNITYTVVNTEEDALLLENSLIKQYKPRYNVLLKDDKTYPYIAVSNEYLPRIFKTRHRERRGATYYGPYSHLPTMYALLDLCQRLYHPRPCHQPMTEEGVRTGKYDLCLNYHIRKCAGPCVLGKQSHEDYLRNIEACREILKGHTREVAQKLREEMATLSEQLRFEEAAALKRKYDLVENFRAKSEVVSNVSYDIDVFSIESDEKIAFINFLHVVNGAITQSFTFEFKKKLDETDEALLALGIVEMRERFSSQSPEDAVAACVVFEKLKPAKNLYRKFHIKTVVGPDDYASMREVVERRYSRLAEEGEALPDLIIADGGVGQMEAIREIVEDRLGLQIPIAGLAKDNRHRTREMLFGNPPVSVSIALDSQLFKLLTRMQDEVHRFAITFHRQQRSKRQAASALDAIAGVGEKTKKQLISHFGSVKRVKEAPLNELQNLVGMKRGENIYRQLHEEIE